MIYSENILICIVIPLLIMLPFIAVKARRLFIALILGMVMSLVGAYLNSFFGVLYGMDMTGIACYIAPVVEELMKMLPIIVYMLLLSPEDSDLLGFAVAVGTGFATFENCCYITQNGAQLIRFVLIRGLAVGVMHVECGLIIGISIVLVKRYRVLMLPGTIGAFAFAMTIHALYNLLVSVEGTPTYIGFCIPVVVMVLIYLMWVKNRNEQKTETGKQGTK